jgi:hypothetical protein
MERAGDNPVEALTGLGACGATLLLTCGTAARHPFIPTIPIAADAADAGVYAITGADAEPMEFARWLQGAGALGANRVNGLADFQVNRGRLGIST